MNKPRIPNPRPEPEDALTVRFVRQLPNEEAVYFARRCALKGQHTGPLTIVLEAKPHAGSPMHEVRLEQEGRVLITESDPEILLAIRNAFDRLTMERMLVAPMLRVAGANLVDAAKVWS